MSYLPLHEAVPVVDPSPAGGVFSLLWVIIALPALGAAAILLLGNRRTSGWAHLLGCATVIGSFAISVAAFVSLLGRGAEERQVGQVLVFFVLVVAAAEVAVGLAIIVAIFRRRQNVTADDVDLLKG